MGPRDGLQNQSETLSIAQRESLVKRLLDAGAREIEVGSFVRDERVPQLAQTAKLLSRLEKCRKEFNPFYWAFVPNIRGMELALETEVDGVGLFVAASETFCKKNVNRSQKELLDAIASILPMAKKAKKKVRVYLSTITYCPYESAIAPSKVVALVKKLTALGVTEISLGDTTGHATPVEISKLLEKLLKQSPAKCFTMHFHDTRGLAVANVWESTKYGIARFDASLGGLGGCPYAPGAAGNLATEDLLYALQSMKAMDSKFSLKKLSSTSFWLEKQLGQTLPSKVLQTLR